VLHCPARRPIPILLLSFLLLLSSAAVAQSPVDHVVILRESISGVGAGPFVVVLDSGAVYRLEASLADPPRIDNPLRLIFAEGPEVGVVYPSGAAVRITSRRGAARPPQIRLALEQGHRRDADVAALLFPMVTGEYHVWLQTPSTDVLTVHLEQREADTVAWQCVRERDAGAPGAACDRVHLARPGRRFGSIPIALAVAVVPPFLALLAGH